MQVAKERLEVELVLDEELERLYPKRETIVEVAFTDGAKLTGRVEAVHGTSDNPMTRDEVVAKARDLIAPVLGAATAGKLIETVLNLENVESIGELRSLLQRA